MNKKLISLFTAAILVTIPTFAGATPSPSDTPVASPTSVVAIDSRVTAQGSSDQPGTDSSVTSAGTATSETGQSSTSAGSSVPSTGLSNTSAGGVNTTPGTGSTVTSAGSTAPGTSGSVTSAGNSTVVTPPVTPVTTGGSSYSSGGGRIMTLPYSASCPLLTSFMKFGFANDPTQVSKLQTFLKNTQNTNVAVTGIFDRNTEYAVKVFQANNQESVLSPWGGNTPSGYVYITTLKKINQITCSQPLTLNASELAVINSYKNGRKLAIGVPKSEVIVTAKGSTPTISPVSITVNGDNNDTNISSSTETNDNVAAVSQPSIAVRFWNFIVSLFI